MIVEQIWTENDYRNFQLFDRFAPRTGEALAIDPLAYDQVSCRREGQGVGR